MKILLPKIALAFLLLLPLLGRAQEIRITGRVVDANTKKPIPFASIGLLKEKLSGITNKKGYFQLSGLDEFNHDSLVFMTVGYNRQAVFVERNKAEGLVVELSPSLSGRATNSLILGRSKMDSSEVIKGLLGTQYAFLIKNQKKQLGKIRTVSFFIGENGFPMKPFCIRIYKADGNYYSPKTDLLNARVFLTATRAGEWYTSDLSHYRIDVPEDGFFVALEFGKPTNAFSQPVLENYVPSGLTMRPAFSVKKNRIWSCSSERSWHLLSQPKGLSRYNTMIKAEVEAAN